MDASTRSKAGPGERRESARRERLAFEPAYEVGPTGERIPATDAHRPGRELVLVAAVADLAFAGVVAVAGHLDSDMSARAFGQAIFVLALFAALAVRCAAMNELALRVRRGLGVGLVAVALLLLVASAGGWIRMGEEFFRFAPLVGAVLLFGAYASHRALVLRERETCAAHPSWDSCVPVHAPWTRMSAAVFVSGIEWIVCGAIDAFVRNLWFGQTIAAFGVFAVIRARNLAPTHTDARLRAVDRRTFSPWWIYPVGAPLLAFRVIWLLMNPR